MSRYIDADKAKEKKVYSKDRHEYVVPVAELDWLPTADVQEVRHGKWIYCGHHDFHGHVFECSVCGRYLFANSKEDVYVEYPYCHCGAKMESVEGLEED